MYTFMRYIQYKLLSSFFLCKIIVIIPISCILNNLQILVIQIQFIYNWFQIKIYYCLVIIFWIKKWYQAMQSINIYTYLGSYSCSNCSNYYYTRGPAYKTVQNTRSSGNLLISLSDVQNKVTFTFLQV